MQISLCCVCYVVRVIFIYLLHIYFLYYCYLFIFIYQLGYLYRSGTECCYWTVGPRNQKLKHRRRFHWLSRVVLNEDFAPLTWIKDGGSDLVNRYGYFFPHAANCVMTVRYISHQEDGVVGCDVSDNFVVTLLVVTLLANIGAQFVTLSVDVIALSASCYMIGKFGTKVWLRRKLKVAGIQLHYSSL